MRTSLALLSAAALLSATAAAGVSSTNPANVHLNELYISHSSTDDMEMIELVGTPSASLDGYVVCVVEGDGTAAGTLDRAWDLTGLTMPADGYFVLGNTAEPALDLDIGADNEIENGTNTIYVVFTSAPAAITALLGTNIATGTDTSLGSLGDIADCVGVGDGSYRGGGDTTFDCCETVGELNAGFGPAGIFRVGDWPGKWSTAFLDFDDVANADLPRTPGAANGTHAVRTYGATKCMHFNGRMLMDVTGDTTSGTGSISIEIRNGPDNGGAGGATCGLFIGLTETELEMSGGCLLHVVPTLSLFLPLDTNGDLVLGPIGIPAGFSGLQIYMQTISSEQGSFVESNGIEMEIL